MYKLENDQGRTISCHSDYEDAVKTAKKFAGPDGIVGHDGDISDGGDKTLIWADEESAENDPGINAIGSIRRGENR